MEKRRRRKSGNIFSQRPAWLHHARMHGPLLAFNDTDKESNGVTRFGVLRLSSPNSTTTAYREANVAAISRFLPFLRYVCPLNTSKYRLDKFLAIPYSIYISRETYPKKSQTYFCQSNFKPYNCTN